MEYQMIDSDKYAGMGQKIELINSIKFAIDPFAIKDIEISSRSGVIHNLYFVMIEDLSLDDPDPGRLEFVGIGDSEKRCLQEAAIILLGISRDLMFSTEDLNYTKHCDWPIFVHKAHLAMRVILSPR